MKKRFQIIFITIFSLMITLPILKINLEKDAISSYEKRTLKQLPSLIDHNGNLNTNFFDDFNEYINDRIGFRDEFIALNNKIEYYAFDQLDNSYDEAIGKNDELYYIGGVAMKNYLHTNLLSEENLDEVIDNFEIINGYLNDNGIQFYYVQCYDKQTIYPEYFLEGVNQDGDLSLTDQIVDGLKERTNINVVSMKELMLEKKTEFRTYNKWSDVAHWSERAAYYGYRYLMSEINKNNDDRYQILDIDDYDITYADNGEYYLGNVHYVDIVEKFNLKENYSLKYNDKLTLHAEDDSRQSYWINENVENDTKVLIFGDSYVQGFIIDDISQSFNTTIQLWSYTISDLPAIIEEYKPNIVIYERVERVYTDFSEFSDAAMEIEKLTKSK